jgi:hypothetical protein
MLPAAGADRVPLVLLAVGPAERLLAADRLQVPDPHDEQREHAAEDDEHERGSGEGKAGHAVGARMKDEGGG